MEAKGTNDKKETKDKKGTNEKEYWIECIKVFSAFLVVAQHSISGMWTTLSPESAQWKLINFVFFLSCNAVPLFFMCSGTGMLKKERTIEGIIKKNICGLLKVYGAWMLVYGLRDSVRLMREGLGSFRTVRNAFLKALLFGQYHTWFIMTLAGLYLITPFLYEIVRNEKYFKYFLILSILFSVFIPLAGEIEGSGRLESALNTINMRFVTGYVMYYVLGYYLSKSTGTRKRGTVILAAILAGGCLAAYGLSNLISAGRGEAFQRVYSEFSPLGVLISSALFLLFRELAGKEKLAGKKELVGQEGPAGKETVERKENPAGKLASLAGCGAGIYLMHPLFLPLTAFFPGVSCILGAVVIWMISALICMLMRQVPLLDRLFLKQSFKRG